MEERYDFNPKDDSNKYLNRPAFCLFYTNLIEIGVLLRRLILPGHPYTFIFPKNQ